MYRINIPLNILFLRFNTTVYSVAKENDIPDFFPGTSIHVLIYNVNVNIYKQYIYCVFGLSGLLYQFIIDQEICVRSIKKL